MKIHFFILSFVLFKTFILAQSPISLNANWTVGEKYQYQVTKVKLKVKNDSITTNDTSAYIGHWKIAEKIQSGFRLKWIMSNEYLNKHKVFEKSKSKKDSNIEFIYTTNTIGEFNELENWKDVRKSIFEIFDEMKNENFESKEDEKVAKASLKFLKAFYKDKYAIQEMIGKEIIAIHGFFGTKLNSKVDTIIEKGEAYSLFSEDPIPTITRLYLKEFDKTGNQCTFYKINKYDPKSAIDLAIKLSKKYGRAPTDEELKNSTLDIQKTHKATFIYSKGIPNWIEKETKTIANTSTETGFSSKKIIIEKIE